MSQAVKKAVLPVAGLGTRVMPLTLHQPKGMIGIVDRPMIHYVIDEVLSAGINHIILVIGPNQSEFKKYISFLQNQDPEWQKLNIRFDFVVQEKPHGNGDAVYMAKKILKNEPFAVAFSDDLLVQKTSPLRTLINFYQKNDAPILMLETVPKKQVSRYGVVNAKPVNKNLYQIFDVVEKPKPEQAPSNLTIIGRYVLTPEILNIIGSLYPYQGKEIGITDALKIYTQSGGKLFGWRFTGRRFDAGSKIGILKAQAYYGAHHPELGKEFKKFLKEI